MYSAVSEQGIRALVDAFYATVRKDELLAPIFSQAIGESEEHWRPHMLRMYDFWSSIMLTSGRYKGTPSIMHQRLPTFDLGLFERWLTLFRSAAFQTHDKDVALSFIAKAENISRSLKMTIEISRLDRPVASR